MKFEVLMKDPDTLRDAIEDAIKAEEFPILDADEIEAVKGKRLEKIYEMCCDNWFEYGEYLRVEIDTDAKTCTVIPRV